MNPSIARVIRKYTRVAAVSDPFAGKKFDYKGEKLSLSTIAKKDPAAAKKIRQRLHHENRNHKDFNVRISIAEHPHTHPKTLHAMRKDEDKNVRWTIAGNPNTHPKTLHAMRKDEHSSIRWGVATNSNTSKETLQDMQNDKSDYVRHSVARRLGDIRRKDARQLKEGK